MGLVLGAVLTLAACGAGAGDDHGGGPPVGEDDHGGGPPVGEALADVDLGPGAQLTGSGEQFAVGDPAVIQVARGDDPDDPDYRHLTLATTVVEVAEAGPEVLEDVADPAAGTAYLVRVDHKVLASEGAGEPQDLIPALVGLREDSAVLPTYQAGVGEDALGDCASVPFDSFEPGGVGRTCLVAVSDAAPATGAAWPGDPWADGEDPADNPYYRFPIMWRE